MRCLVFTTRHRIFFSLLFLECQPDQSISLICHEQGDVQHVTIQFQVIQREAYTELNFLREQLLEFL